MNKYSLQHQQNSHDQQSSHSIPAALRHIPSVKQLPPVPLGLKAAFNSQDGEEESQETQTWRGSLGSVTRDFWL